MRVHSAQLRPDWGFLAFWVGLLIGCQCLGASWIHGECNFEVFRVSTYLLLGCIYGVVMCAGGGLKVSMVDLDERAPLMGSIK